jgi:hypothetical protein
LASRSLIRKNEKNALGLLRFHFPSIKERNASSERLSGGAVAAAAWFESLAVASHPLQRRRAETIFYYVQSRCSYPEIREPTPGV